MPVPRVGLESPLPSLVVVKLARLSIVPVAQVVLSVWLKMWTVKLAPEARPVGPQVRVIGLVVRMVQTGLAGAWVFSCQVRPALVGSLFPYTTLFRSPGPALVATIV